MSWASANTKRAGRGRCSQHWLMRPCPRCRRVSEVEAKDRARSTLTLLSRVAVWVYMELEAKALLAIDERYDGVGDIAINRNEVIADALRRGLLSVDWGRP